MPEELSKPTRLERQAECKRKSISFFKLLTTILQGAKPHLTSSLIGPGVPLSYPSGSRPGSHTRGMRRKARSQGKKTFCVNRKTRYV
jgi:hypothetical protein